ncbi:MAPK/MAK/MRK overlapping kinase [Empidonax traillii]|uniref:MAPK/MAK/MRK overlapping kinase n=1 Tax=Empidonax traillii TaxID=164674 RepID=UPI000FFD166F|nr:MAPK/MAK/MRK overlapping kinase [Empidonax traillii]
MKQHFERVHEAVIQSGLALSSPCGSFLGSNELDQISKIHDIIGTPAKTTLKKFKQWILHSVAHTVLQGYLFHNKFFAVKPLETIYTSLAVG